MKNAIPTMKNLMLTIKHKWFVFLAGRKLGVKLWRLIKHDWSKFLPSELPHYGRQFFGDKDQGLSFALCWTRHQNRHEHHWEYWVPRTSHSGGGFKDNEPLPMTVQAVREMVADWMGAGRAYNNQWPDPDNWTWVLENMPEMRLHRFTKVKIRRAIERIK